MAIAAKKKIVKSVKDVDLLIDEPTVLSDNTQTVSSQHVVGKVQRYTHAYSRKMVDELGRFTVVISSRSW